MMHMMQYDYPYCTQKIVYNFGIFSAIGLTHDAHDAIGLTHDDVGEMLIYVGQSTRSKIITGSL